MTMLHDYKQPDLGILGSFKYSLQAGRLAGVPNSITLSPFMSELALLGSEPSRCQGFVRKNEEGS